MRREIAWENSAAKEFDRLPEAVQESIYSALARPAIEGRGDVKALVGPLAGTLRLRVGQYRLRFRLDADTGKIVILAVAGRGHAYRD